VGTRRHVCVRSGELSGFRRRKFSGYVSHFVSESGELFGLPLSLVQHFGQRLEGSQRQLEGHAVRMTRRCFLQQVLEEKDKLWKPLNWFHHQPEEGNSVVGRDLQKIIIL